MEALGGMSTYPSMWRPDSVTSLRRKFPRMDEASHRGHGTTRYRQICEVREHYQSEKLLTEKMTLPSIDILNS